MSEPTGETFVSGDCDCRDDHASWCPRYDQRAHEPAKPRLGLFAQINSSKRILQSKRNADRQASLDEALTHAMSARGQLWMTGPDWLVDQIDELIYYIKLEQPSTDAPESDRCRTCRHTLRSHAGSNFNAPCAFAGCGCERYKP